MRSFAFLKMLVLISMLASSNAFSSDPYFQQRVNYSISVRLNDRLHQLSAFEKITYVNNSPDTLDFLYFHLWPNAYSNNSTALAKQLLRTSGKQKLFNSISARGFIDSLDFKINGSKISWNLTDNPDICILYPDTPLLPGDSIEISTPFRVKIPQGNISRMGFSGGAYQVSQWYPKPAVYDKNGWHPLPYLDQGEFYSEFGNFTIRITLPADFLVAASGDLLTISESNRLKALSAGDYSSLMKGKDPEEKTLEYFSVNVHDFAWVAGPNFLVREDMLRLPHSGKEVRVMIMYTPGQAVIWNDALEYVRRSILCFSDWIGEYPYKSFVAVQSAIAAGSGMEYPGMAIIGDEDDAYSLDEVIAHEVCHSWFYGSLGSDERSYPFIDEGLATAYEERYMDLLYPGKKLWEVYMRNYKMARFFNITDLPVGLMSELQWLDQARNNLDQPADLPADRYTDRNYSDIIYFKTPHGFNLLRRYLGDALFDSIMHQFYLNWSGKHPSPDDLRSAFESGSGRRLSWFFNDYLGSLKRADYAVRKVQDDSLLVVNRGEMAPPFPVYGLNEKKISEAAWFEGFHGKKWLHMPVNSFDELRINSTHILPELNYLNNNIRTSGIFKKSDPLRIRMFMSLEDPAEGSIMLVPLVNWTRIDGFMIGVGLNNGTLLSKRTEIFAVPFYTFRNNDIAGSARIAFNFIPFNSIIRKATLSFNGARFGSPWSGHYNVLGSEIDLHLRSGDPLLSMDKMIFGRIILAQKFPVADDLNDPGNTWFGQGGYTFSRSGPLNPYTFYSLLEKNVDFIKSSAEFRYRFSYNGRDRGLDMRLYAGAMLLESKLRRYYSLAPSGRSGRELYLYQGDFPDRFAGFPSSFWSRQMMLSEGGIVSPVNDTTGYSPWLISATFASNLPGRAGIIPFKPFFNFVWNGNENFRFLYEAGFKSGIKDIFEIYVPLLVSNNINVYRSTIRERIRFTLNLGSLYKVRLQ